MQDSMQDWKPMILTKSKSSSKTSPSKPVTKLSDDAIKANKIDNATEAGAIEYMPKNIVAQLITFRTTKKKSQKDVANSLNLNIKVIQDIERGKYKKDMRLAQRIATSLGGQLKK